MQALDILSGANLINYFGKTNDIKDIEIAPILLRKGTTKLAMYGLGNIRDERLFQTWKKVSLIFSHDISLENDDSDERK